MQVPKKPKIDMDELHRLYIAGVPIMNIALELFIDPTYCSAIITKQRLGDPDKWPLRDLKGRTKVEEVIKPKAKIEATHKREQRNFVPQSGMYREYHISELPQAEQDRLMNLVDPNRKTKPAFGGGWGMLP